MAPLSRAYRSLNPKALSYLGVVLALLALVKLGQDPWFLLLCAGSAAALFLGEHHPRAKDIPDARLYSLVCSRISENLIFINFLFPWFLLGLLNLLLTFRSARRKEVTLPLLAAYTAWTAFRRL